MEYKNGSKSLIDELPAMESQMPEEFNEFGNVLIYKNKSKNDAYTDTYGIKDGLKYGKIEDSDDWYSLDELKKMNKYTPIYAWEYMNGEEMEMYVDPELCVEDDEIILVVLLSEQTGEIPKEEIWEKVKNDEITDEIKARLIYSISKKAKSCRGWHLKKKDSDQRVRKEGRKDEAEYNRYYEMKDALLNDIPVTEYHYDRERNTLYDYRELCGYGYHSIIGDYDENEARKKAETKNLPLKILEDGLFVAGTKVNSDSIYCDEFVDFVFEKLEG